MNAQTGDTTHSTPPIVTAS